MKTTLDLKVYTDALTPTPARVRHLRDLDVGAAELAEEDDRNGSSSNARRLAADLATAYAGFVAAPDTKRWRKLEDAMMAYQSYATTAGDLD